MGSYYLTGTELKMEGWLDSNVNMLDVIELHIENDYVLCCTCFNI